MLNLDEEALLCDLAETYQIYDIEALPLNKVALFSVGLREDSRIMMKIADVRYTVSNTLLMNIVDRLTLLTWMLAGCKKSKKPKLLSDKLLNHDKNDDITTFTDSNDFEKVRNSFLMKGG